MARSLFTAHDYRFAETLARLAATNPFLGERIQLEREALGPHFREEASFWVPDAGALELEASQLERPNLEALGARAVEVARVTRARFAQGVCPSEHELEVYQDLCLYVLLHQYNARLFELSRDARKKSRRVTWFKQFQRDFEALLGIDGVRWPLPVSPELALGWLFQLRRAFHYVFRYLLGSSPVSARLRAEIWESIFTRDIRRYKRGLYGRMHDIVTLITGPTGSGKELLAQAIGLSRFVPFDANQSQFSDFFADQYHPLHLAALPVALVESELFGHRRGAYTGAVEDRVGWLESCGPSGTVFLDEVGELPLEVQVKLLRAVQERTFNRLGEAATRSFLGKLVAATHRDLAAEMRAGRFRPDLFHRLSADHIRAPSLKERIESDPEELPYLVRQLSRRMVGDEGAQEVAGETLQFIEGQLGWSYSWPGNVRELEQCVRSVLVRGSYQPPALGPRQARASALDAALLESGLSLRELEQRYASLMYLETGNYSEAGRRLDVDWRTLKQHVSPKLLRQLERERAEPRAGET